MHAESAAADRIVMLTSLVTAGVAAASLVALPTWHLLQLSVLGSELSLAPGGRAVVVLLLLLLTAAGVDDIVRTAPGLHGVSVQYTATFWILPCLVTTAAGSAVPAQADNVRAWLVSLCLLTLLLLLVLLASYHTARADSPLYRPSRLILNLATYGAAFALYSTIYGLRIRSLLSTTAVLFITFLLALELLRGTEEQVETTWLYAGVIAVICAELTWALNVWGLSALSGGALLLLVFYATTGISQQHLAGRLTREVVIEFVAVALFGLGAVLLSQPWLG